MSHDPRRFGGQEYAPQPNVPDTYPQPTMRPAPQSFATERESQPDFAPPRSQQSAAAAVAASVGEPADTEDANTIELSRAYQAHGEFVRRLSFRKPTGADLRKFGYPVRQIINPDTGRVESIEVNAAIAAKYIVALSSPPIPPSTIDAMEIRDADACNGVIVSFFMG